MKLTKLAQCIALIGIAAPAVAQDVPYQRVEITGSSIKRIAKEGALPVEVITKKQIEEQGIVTAEQLIMNLNINGTGSDNLASNADVTTGAARGNNGASSANLRGQGAESTLILLNGRRVATHGMKGAAVDLNSIPFAAVERVEVLKDGASAIYGTDAIGGVINFILKKNYKGFETQAFTDITEAGGGNIFRLQVTGGAGDLETDGYNFLFAGGRTEAKMLRGSQRDFVNTFQPDRGVSVDTRGTPFATVVTAAGSILGTAGLRLPGTSATSQAYQSINILDLPGGKGCNSIDGMGPYDEKIWSSPASTYACAWDTGRAAVLAQPVESNNFVARATKKLGDHQVFVEAVGSRTDSAKSFSPNQISPGTSLPTSSYYPATGPMYNTVFNAIAAVFPSVEANRGLPIAYRWRCMECGNREIKTTSEAARLQIGADGPVTLPFFGNFDYKVGLSRAYSKAESELGSGYNYTEALAKVLGSGLFNPFLMPGEKQSQAAIDAINATSAAGVKLYGGKSTLTQADAGLSGEVFKMPAGMAMAAVGIDLRREQYQFGGDSRPANARPAIWQAAFDDVNALSTVTRTVKAFYGELLLPLTKELEVNMALRTDDYSGFGRTTNPKISFRYTPVSTVLFRGSYNEGFRAPSFNQLFNGVTESPYTGKDLVDPASCPSGVVNPNVAGCAVVTPTILTGGRVNLGPETAKQGTVGVVWEFAPRFSTSVDVWEIRKQNSIRSVSLTDMIANYNLFSENFIRLPATVNGVTTTVLAQIDQRPVNAGASLTRGLEFTLRGAGDVAGWKWNAGLDGSRLLAKKSKLLPTSDYGASEVGVFSYYGDLGLKWKHTAFVTFKQGVWSATLTEVYRNGYKDQVLPGVKNGTVVPPNLNPLVHSYNIFHASVSYTGVKNLTLTAGIKNLFDKDPPFAITYDSNSGAGSTWEPRVADPRGRSFSLLANYKFL